MFNRTHAQASPSVTLEKGIARLQPVRANNPQRRISGKGQSGPVLPTEAERRAAFILACVAFVTLLVVCLTLYLLNHSSRWEISSLLFSTRSELRFSVPRDQSITPLPRPRPIHPHPSSHRDPLEHYISYLPHSGFHNQRIALENALVLSHILNRTLLVPPVLLGEPPLRYRPYVNLRDDVSLSSKVGLEHCALVPESTYIPEECTDFWSHAHVPWEWFVDLSPVSRQHGIKTLLRWDLTDKFLARLRINHANTYTLADGDAYEFRFFDSLTDEKPLGSRYKSRVDIPTLVTRAQSHRLLQFGTLFGTTRIRLSNAAHIAVRTDVRRAMVFTNPELLAIANGVRDSHKLDHGEYAAVHLRLGDGIFAGGETRVQNVRSVWWKLVRELGVSQEDAWTVESKLRSAKDVLMPPPPQTRDAAALRTPHPPPPPLNQSSECRGNVPHPSLGIPLYIATDKPNHRALSIFRQTFPCAYFLSDFATHTADLHNLGIMPTPEDGTLLDHIPLAPFLPPFLDAIIASKARVVIGTQGSTFSRFVEDVLWRAYHGWDIVQRG